MIRIIFSHLAVLLICSIIISCAPLKSLFIKDSVVSDCFSEEDFVIFERKIIDKNYSYYIAKEKVSNHYHIVYVDEYKYCEDGDYYVVSKLLIPPLDSSQYVRSGSFLDNKGEKQVVISIEEFMPEGVSGYSIDFYNLWILNRKKEKFIKKNENKYLRVHLGYYLKSDSASYVKDEDYIELMRSQEDR